MKRILYGIVGVIMAMPSFAVDDPIVGDKTTTSQPYVYNQIEMTQVKIPAANPSNTNIGSTVVTYTNVAGGGTIGERGLFTGGEYNASNDADKLITASALNNTFTNLPTTDTTTLQCANQDCTLWTIVDQTAYGETITLPAGYTRLEYIQSTGTQYIDLGYKGNGKTKVAVKFKYHTVTSASGSGRVFGSRTSSTSNAFAIGASTGSVTQTGNKLFWCYDAQSYFVISAPTFPVGDWQTVVFSATEHTLNGVSYGTDYNVVEFETPQNLKLFGFDDSGTMRSGYVGIAYCKVWDNGVLIRDLVPAKNSSNVVGMYDLVTNTFFTNAGTGSFVAGPVVN